MLWTYSGDPSTSTLDELRFLIGDTDTSNPQLSDDELRYWLNQVNDDPKLAALSSLNSLITKAAYQVNYTIGPEKVEAEALYSHLLSLREQLKESLTTFTATIGDVFPNMAKPIFEKGMFDNARYR